MIVILLKTCFECNNIEYDMLHDFGCTNKLELTSVLYDSNVANIGAGIIISNVKYSSNYAYFAGSRISTLISDSPAKSDSE